MFSILDKNNIEDFESSFLKKEDVESELSNNPFGYYLLYIEDNEVLGYLYYSDIYERMEINSFEVNPEFRNKGIGSKLMKEFTENTSKGVTLEVRCNNESAIHIYKKYGFIEKAKRIGYYDGLDGILMERK